MTGPTNHSTGPAQKAVQAGEFSRFGHQPFPTHMEQAGQG